MLINVFRIFVDLSLLDLTFAVFLPSLEKRTVFQSSLQAENYFGQVVLKPEVCKSYVTLFYCMITCPMPYSVWYLQWRVQPNPVYSTVFSS